MPHTHWDREWYLPFEQFQLRLAAVVDEVIEVLEQDPSFASFTLDGQAIVLEDYLEARPEHEGRLRALIAAGRLEVGPSYVLPDELLVGGESLRAQPAARARDRVRAVRRATVAGRLPARQLRASACSFRRSWPGSGSTASSSRAGWAMSWTRSAWCSAGVRRRGARCAPSSSSPSYCELRGPERCGRRAGARSRRSRSQFAGALSAPACTISCCAPATITCGCGVICLRFAPSSSSGCPGTEVRIATYSDYVDALEPGRPRCSPGNCSAAGLQNILRGVNSARLYLKQANERAERLLLAAETVSALRVLGTGETSRCATSAWPGASCCAASRTTRSAAARATRFTATCSSATSCSTAPGRARAPRPRGVHEPAPARTRGRRRERRCPTAAAGWSKMPGTEPVVVELDGFAARTVELPPGASRGSAARGHRDRERPIPGGGRTTTAR